MSSKRIRMEISMLRKATIVLAIAMLLEGSGLSTAVARGKDPRSAFGALSAEQFAVGTGSMADGRHEGPRARGLRRTFPAYGHRDVWGHWGTYYGPMVAAPF